MIGLHEATDEQMIVACNIIRVRFKKCRVKGEVVQYEFFQLIKNRTFFGEKTLYGFELFGARRARDQVLKIWSDEDATPFKEKLKVEILEHALLEFIPSEDRYLQMMDLFQPLKIVHRPCTVP